VAAITSTVAIDDVYAGGEHALVVELVGLGDLEFDKSRKDSTIEIGSQG